MPDEAREAHRQPVAPARYLIARVSAWMQSFSHQKIDLSFTLLVETPHQRGGCLTPPGVEDELLELVAVDRGEPNQDGREAVIVRLGEERARASSEQHVLLGEVAYPDGDDVQIGHARLFRMDTFHPDPGNTFALAVIVDPERRTGASSLMLLRGHKIVVFET